MTEYSILILRLKFCKVLPLKNKINSWITNGSGEDHCGDLETLISEWYYYPTICHLHNFSDKKFGGTGIWEILHNFFVWLSLEN
jgi:hypothetical protein